jgi:hypothetical protein
LGQNDLKLGDLGRVSSASGSNLPRIWSGMSKEVGF